MVPERQEAELRLRSDAQAIETAPEAETGTALQTHLVEAGILANQQPPPPPPPPVPDHRGNDPRPQLQQANHTAPQAENGTALLTHLVEAGISANQEPPPPPPPPVPDHRGNYPRPEPQLATETATYTHMQQWHFRYFNMVPERQEAELRLRSDGQARFLTPETDSEYHGRWWNTPDGLLEARFHFAGERASIRRRMSFFHVAGSTTWISRGASAYPVTMVFDRSSRIAVPPPAQHGAPVGVPTPSPSHDDLAIANAMVENGAYLQHLQWEFADLPSILTDPHRGF